MPAGMVTVIGMAPAAVVGSRSLQEEAGAVEEEVVAAAAPAVVALAEQQW